MFIQVASLLMTLYKASGISFSPADGLTYYFGPAPAAPSTTQWRRQGTFDRVGKIRSVYVEWYMTGTTGSAEDITVSLELTGGLSIPLLQLVGMTGYKRFGEVNLSVDVSDLLNYEVKIVCPTWATNPTAVVVNANIWVEE